MTRLGGWVIGSVLVFELKCILVASTQGINLINFTSWTVMVKFSNMKLSTEETHPEKEKGPKIVSLSILLLVSVVLQNNFASFVYKFAW